MVGGNGNVVKDIQEAIRKAEGEVRKDTNDPHLRSILTEWKLLKEVST